MRKYDFDLRAHSDIQLCLANEVLRQVTNEDSTAGLRLNIESHYDKIAHKPYIFETRALYPANKRR